MLKYTDGYHVEYPEIIFRLMLLGATVEQVAEALGTSQSTLKQWSEAHKEVRDAIANGRRIADSEVAYALYRRAKGYEHPDVDIRVIDGVVVQTPITKIYPPETVACIFWLKNRDRENWRDKVEHGLTDKQGKDVALPPEELARRVAFLFAQAEAAAEKRPEGSTVQ